MPKIKSAKKRLRQSLRRASVNKIKKEAYKTIKRQIKKVAGTGEAGKEKLEELGQKFYQAVDKAAKTGVIHRNKASREKSRIMALVRPSVISSSKKEIKPRNKRSKAAKKTARAKVSKANRKKASSRKAK